MVNVFFLELPCLLEQDGMRHFDNDMKTVPNERVRQIVPCFLCRYSLLSVSLLGEGNINDTYLVEFSDRASVVLQRINGNVFPDPVRVADNVHLVTEHIRHQKPSPDSVRRTLGVIPTTSGNSCLVDDDGHVWRMVNYLENTECFPTVCSDSQAFEGGAMLGWFHRQLDDLSLDRVLNPLPGFHDLPAYCRHFQQVVSSHKKKLTPDLQYCCQEADRRLPEAAILQSALRSGKTRTRVIHGDPKIGNILFDKDSKRAVALIDLDTVSTGILHYDIGDCLRSYCNVLGEDPRRPDGVVFDLDICQLMLKGYSGSGVYFPASERNLVYQGVRLLTYELALRFLTDFLDNNHYFKVSDEDENLRRAVVQFFLLGSIEKQQESIEKFALQTPDQDYNGSTR